MAEVRSTQPIFIVGVGRSGTSLVQSILASHPDVFFPPESGDEFEEAFLIRGPLAEAIVQELAVLLKGHGKACHEEFGDQPSAPEEARGLARIPPDDRLSAGDLDEALGNRSQRIETDGRLQGNTFRANTGRLSLDQKRVTHLVVSDFAQSGHIGSSRETDG